MKKIKGLLMLKNYEINSLEYENQLVIVLSSFFALAFSIINLFFFTGVYKQDFQQVLLNSAVLLGISFAYYTILLGIKEEQHKLIAFNSLTIGSIIFFFSKYYELIGPTVWTYVFTIMVISLLRENSSTIRCISFVLALLGLYLWSSDIEYVIDTRYYIAQFIGFTILSLTTLFVLYNNKQKNTSITENYLIVKKSEQGVCAILEAMPDRVLKFSYNGGLIDLGVELGNSKCSGLWMEGREPFIEELNSENISLIMALIENTFKNKSQQTNEFQVTHLTETAYFEARTALINEIEVLIVIRDISSSKTQQCRIEYLSYHDQLTGIYNRWFFEEELKRINTERNRPVSVVMLDVNGLKLTNDVFGHYEGDCLLKSVVQLLQNLCREDEIISRIGGDEFVILLPRTSHKEAEKFVERIYEVFQNQEIYHLPVSVSIGWSTISNSEDTMKKCFALAEEKMYQNKLVESQTMRNHTIDAILQMLNEKSHTEKLHAEKVSTLCKQMGIEMAMDSDKISELEVAGLMHDIGKISISDIILNNPGILNEQEFTEFKKHPESGYQILKSVDAYTALAEHVLSHHERWDGNGYPRKLEGNQISVVARIIAIADAYEAMTSDYRTYRLKMSSEEAIKELRHYAGSQFDPILANVFAKMIENKKKLAAK
jgi:diguanylate cyclase (GGDEF)-like protein